MWIVFRFLKTRKQKANKKQKNAMQEEEDKDFKSGKNVAISLSIKPLWL